MLIIKKMRRRPQEDAQPVVLSHHAGVRHDILTGTLLGIQAPFPTLTKCQNG
jgi:hypothetical protein